MHSGQVYPALARALEYWSELQPQKLQALIGATPNECKGLPPSHMRSIELAAGTYGLKMWKSSPSMTQ
jgi:hypothetical protein